LAQYFLGIDAGLTVTKAVVFALDGTQVAVEARRVRTVSEVPRHVERDQDELWEAVVAAVRGVLVAARINPVDIAGIGVTAHGDGLYFVDEDLRPVGRGIASLDTRAGDILRRWHEDGTDRRALEVTGQMPFASTPATLLAWFAEHDPDTLARAAWALPCKDVLKARLTGRVSTDRTEASLSFVNYRTQEYSVDAFEVYGLGAYRDLFSPAYDSTEIVGELTDDAARQLGLMAGTPVAASAHDVDCSALGTGAWQPGAMSVIAGTYSINQSISAAPAPDPAWCTRNFVVPGQWMNQAVSPSSATNMEWFVQRVMVGPGGVSGADVFARVEAEIAEIDLDADEVIYAPFLYGSPLDADASASFLGVRGWHTRGHLLRAVMQGVAFNHRHHIDALRAAFPVDRIHLTGGATQSPRWAQMFADVLNAEVAIAAVSESGALGACMLTAVAVGAHASLGEAVDAMVGELRAFAPSTQAVARYEAGYTRYRAALAALEPFWGPAS
jgi:L-xylulokinase